MNKCIEYTGKCVVGNGYLTLQINKKRFYAHRLVAMLFHGLEIQDTKSIVLHICDNPKCINPEHLRIGTTKDNVLDCISKNRFKNPPKLIGEDNHKAKLTWEQVRQIRLIGSLSSKSYREIALEFSVTPETISNIIRGLTWKEQFSKV